MDLTHLKEAFKGQAPPFTSKGSINEIKQVLPIKWIDNRIVLLEATNLIYRWWNLGKSLRFAQFTADGRDMIVKALNKDPDTHHKAASQQGRCNHWFEYDVVTRSWGTEPVAVSAGLTADSMMKLTGPVQVKQHPTKIDEMRREGGKRARTETAKDLPETRQPRRSGRLHHAERPGYNIKDLSLAFNIELQNNDEISSIPQGKRRRRNRNVQSEDDHNDTSISDDQPSLPRRKCDNGNLESRSAESADSPSLHTNTSSRGTQSLSSDSPSTPPQQSDNANKHRKRQRVAPTVRNPRPDKTNSHLPQTPRSAFPTLPLPVTLTATEESLVHVNVSKVLNRTLPPFSIREMAASPLEPVTIHSFYAKMRSILWTGSADQIPELRAGITGTRGGQVLPGVQMVGILEGNQKAFNTMLRRIKMELMEQKAIFDENEGAEDGVEAGCKLVLMWPNQNI